MGEKRITGAVEVRKPCSWGEAMDGGAYRGLHKENTYPKATDWENQRT